MDIEESRKVQREFSRNYPEMAFQLSKLLSKKAEDLFDGHDLEQIKQAASHKPNDGYYGGTPEGAIVCTILYFGAAVKKKYGDEPYEKFYETITKNLKNPILLELKMTGMVLHDGVANTIIGKFQK